MNLISANSSDRPIEVYAHKFVAPSPNASSIVRTAILERVFGSSPARVVFLQAPTGHGKSTALAQFKARCEAQGLLTGWLTFDEADNDTRRFSSYFKTLLATLSGNGDMRGIFEEVQLRDPDSQYRSDWVIDGLLQLDRPIGLFFDEFQTLTDKSILAFWRDLLARSPYNVRIFIGSRSLPDIGLMRLVVQSQAMIVREEDLRFSHAEVQCFFEKSGSNLSADDVQAIYRRTEGWPAAVQLFLLSLTSSSTRKSLGDIASYRPRELAEYLAESVLSLQTPQLREFLLRTSLLARMSAPLCDLVTGRNDSQQVLLGLERAGLFVRSLDSELRWFKYHALFSSFLADQIQVADPDVANEVHRCAAGWYLMQGDHEEAIYHAIECGDNTMAADVLNAWSSRLVANGHMMTVERWYDRLPFEEVAKRPDLMIKVAWALAFLNRRQKGQRVLELLETRRNAGDLLTTMSSEIVVAIAAMCADDIPRAFTGIERVHISSYEADGFSAFELAAAANMHAYRALIMGKFDDWHDFLTKAKVYNLLGGASFSGGFTAGFEGVGLMVQGQLREALRCFRDGLDKQRALLDKSFVSAALASCYVWALYEANELDLVESVFEEYSETMAEAPVPDFLSVGHLAMARTHLARGRRGLATDVLDQAERVAMVNGWPRIVRVVKWERVRRLLSDGDRERADALAAAAQNPDEPLPSGWIPFSEEQEGEVFARIRLALAAGNLKMAESAIANELARSTGRTYRQIKLYLLEALLNVGRGSPSGAHRSLRRAIHLAVLGHFVRVFLDEGSGMISLLREELESGEGGVDHRGFVKSLLQAAGVDPGRTEAQPGSHEPVDQVLTEREKEILLYLAEGVSNRVMAGRIFLSENTVKFHLKNIYSKLAVGSRLEAIAVAKQLGILQ